MALDSNPQILFIYVFNIADKIIWYLVNNPNLHAKMNALACTL
jgi:hypothetical protein